jgi:hypothetical protein
MSERYIAVRASRSGRRLVPSMKIEQGDIVAAHDGAGELFHREPN